MKQLRMFVVLILFSLGCDKEIVPVKRKITFGFSVRSHENGRQKDQATPAFVFLNLENAGGGEVQSLKLPLVAFGQGFITESVELRTGNYVLTRFSVLDADNKVIYATPMEGSPLAQFVSDPLPFPFTVGERTEVQVVPEVIGVTEVTEPGDFGYASFGFDIVKITALQIPVTDEVISKIECRFIRDGEDLFSEMSAPQSIVDLDEPGLLGKTWQSTITLWIVNENCDQKKYRFEGNITFDGNVVRLPVFQSDEWRGYYYQELTDIAVWYPADPRKFADFEVIKIGGGYPWGVVDMCYWHDTEAQQSNEPCSVDCDFIEFYGEGEFQLPGISAACTEASDKIAYVDGLFVYSLGTYQDTGVHQHYFQWEVRDGEIRPKHCWPTPSGGRQPSVVPRKVIARKR